MAHLAPATSPPTADAARPWYRELNRYHWFVLVVCTLGWLFDCLDQQLFNLARKPAMADLLHTSLTDPQVDRYGAIATSLLLIGWATGGIIFGIMGDRIGRVKTMVCTILAYSLFTGLSGFAVGPWDFLAYRFVAGLGVGGQFAVGVALVAESLPDRTRPHALGMLQAFSAVGNVGAAVISLVLVELAAEEVIGSAWRWMFAIGIAPALLVVVIISKLREPEAWKRAVVEGGTAKKAGSLGELFGDPRWRRRAIVGLFLASAGVIGLWGIGVFSNDLTQSIFRKQYETASREAGEAEKDRQFVVQVVRSPSELAGIKHRVQARDLLGAGAQDRDVRQLYAAALALEADQQPISPESVLKRLDQPAAGKPGQSDEERARRAGLLAGAAGDSSLEEHVCRIAAREKEIGSRVGRWAAVTLMLFNIGGFFGMYLFARVTARIGRRPTFAMALAVAAASTVVAFIFMSQPRDLFWMVPLMGACQLSVFGGYAIYFPELFPTRLRSTGTSFCYNIGRYVAATGPLGLGLLTTEVFAGTVEPMRWAGVAMCCVYLVGILVLPFAPETRGQPLPE